MLSSSSVVLQQLFSGSLFSLIVSQNPHLVHDNGPLTSIQGDSIIDCSPDRKARIGIVFSR